MASESGSQGRQWCGGSQGRQWWRSNQNYVRLIIDENPPPLKHRTRTLRQHDPDTAGDSSNISFRAAVCPLKIF